MLPRRPLEPPPRYVAFVARHLGPLREDAARVVGDPGDADRLYPDVLTDVAARWGWLELLRTRLNRPDAADEYLDRAFAHRSQRWQSEQWELTGPTWGGWVDLEVWGNEAPRPLWSSAAVRLAPQLRPSREVIIAPVAEAAVAWWHAYESRRRNWRIAIVVLIVLALAGLSRFTHDSQDTGIDGYHRPARMIVAGIDSSQTMHRGLPG